MTTRFSASLTASLVLALSTFSLPALAQPYVPLQPPVVYVAQPAYAPAVPVAYIVPPDGAPVDRVPDKRLDKHVEWAIGTGPSATILTNGEGSAAVFHAHFNGMIGAEVWKAPLGEDVLSLGLGYIGSIEVNDAELLHRHGIGLMLRKSFLYASLGAGITFLNDFSSATMFMGGHLALDWGFRAGPVQIGLPIVLDIIDFQALGTFSATTFALTLGVQL